jgi:glycosyltransferase involved in cell wall biosynthesis
MEKTVKKLRIAEIGSIWETTPPKLYGGTERIVHNLTEELVKKGHDVTLFATGDSKSSAKLESTLDTAAYRRDIPWTNFLHPLFHHANAFEKSHKFDIMHVHINTRQDYVALVLAGLVDVPVVFTIHFALPLEKDKEKEDRLMFLKKYKDHNYISISNAQRTLPFLNYIATVYNGLDFDQYKFKEADLTAKKEYIVWIGRFCKDKGTHVAIEVAKKSGIPLVLAGKIDEHNEEYKEYYEKEVKPHIDGKLITYIGEVDNAEKSKLFKNAIALLNPIQWNEPFGLTSIEAMAHGVPVIALDKGPMKEIIADGKTGFVVKNANEMVRALKKVGELNRNLIRQYALSHFSSSVMADNYEKVYLNVLKKNGKK